MKRARFVPAIWALAAIALTCGFANAAPVALTGAERAQALQQANKALSVPGPLQGRFVQISPNGKSAGGTFYLQRPGKVRFAYDAPSAMQIVSDGRVVSIEDRALKTVNRAPLNTTPLDLLLKRSVDLERDTKVLMVAGDADTMLVVLRDKSRQTNGELTLFFDGPARELRRWQVMDPAGNITLTALQTVQNVAVLDQKLFKTATPPPAPRSRP
jgi:outer membrane lipoprotein-sorting protein